MKRTFAALAAFALVPAAAVAAPGDLEVDYSDLDLSNQKDIKKLERRIKTAAKEFCLAETGTTGTRMISREARACTKSVEASAMERFATVIEEQRKGG